MPSLEFQFKTLGFVMENPIYQLGDYPLPEHFENPTAFRLCKIIRETSQRLKEPISYGILKDVICKQRKKDPEMAKQLAIGWKKMRRPISKLDQKYIEKEMAEMCRRAAVQDALLRSVDLWKEERIDEIEDAIQRALLVGKSNGGLGTFFFSQAPEILSKEEQYFKPIRTLISALDAHLPHGGLCAKDLGVLLGLSGFGKTMGLLHMAKAALIQKKKVVYFTMEMSEPDLSERLIASFSGIPTDEIFKRSHRAARQVRGFGKMLGDNLLIKHFPAQTASVNTLDAHLRLVYAQAGIKFDLVVVDYVGEMAGIKKAARQGSSERYYELGGIFSDLVGWIQELDISGWTAAQANRAKGRELITIEDIAEAFKGVFGASTVASINQTLEELQNQQMRIFLAKNRKGISRVIIPIHTNFAKGSFARKMQAAEDE